jgi:mRNA interferase YafQ
MKFEPKHELQFRRDYKQCIKRGWSIRHLQEIMLKLEAGESLDPVKNRPHFLTGKNPHVTECHIENDWLLEYRYENNIIVYIRTGTHADLFG